MDLTEEETKNKRQHTIIHKMFTALKTTMLVCFGNKLGNWEN